MSVAIKIENLSKQYRLGLVSTRTLSHDLNRWWQMNIRGKEDPYLKIGQENKLTTHNSQLTTHNSLEYVWALKDINLEVEEGEVLGIIGKNGAGKSTLLKILSKVTAPTTGVVKARGRIASLLEVGTGFHQEMTGRENIYLNGSIMGMTKSEITRKLDEIVDFAGVEKYIDTPVKRYSSGMVVRLGFSIAAHLEPEILVVDEVLAVGDAEFQKKALGKMQDVSKGQGRTILFVSHNMAAITSLCHKGIVLRNGEMDCKKTTIDSAVGHYLRQVTNLAQSKFEDRVDRHGIGQIRITGFEIVNERNIQQEFASSGQFIEFRICYKCKEGFKAKNVDSAISFTSQSGVFITMLSNQISSEPFSSIPQEGYLSCQIPKLPFSPGNYILNLIINERGQIQDWLQEAFILTVESGDFFGTGRLPPISHSGIYLTQKWSYSEINEIN